MAANNNKLSPRQKMINLMYIVLTAMLALNVSSDVLDGFTQVHDGLNRSNSNVGQRNERPFIAASRNSRPVIPTRAGRGSTKRLT